MIDTIIFDAEGVVIDTEPLWDKSQELLLSRRNIEYDRNRIKHLITGRSFRDGSLIIKEAYGIDEDLNSFMAEREAIVDSLFKKEVHFLEGFREFFDLVKSRFKVCIATSLKKNLLKLVDHRLEIYKLFDDNIYSVSDIGDISKPDPAIFNYAALKMGSDPGSCLVIEDSPNGIKAAKAAGMLCYAITSTYPEELLSEADVVVDSYKNIDLGKLGK